MTAVNIITLTLTLFLTTFEISGIIACFVGFKRNSDPLIWLGMGLLGFGSLMPLITEIVRILI